MAKRTASAKKQARASVGRTLRNRSAKSEVKTRVIRVRKAIGEHDLTTAAEAAALAISVLDRVGSKGILHPNNAARRKSRLMKAMNAAGVSEAPAAEAKAVKKQTAKPKTAKPKTAAAKKATVKKAIAAKKSPAKPAAAAPAKKSPAKKASAKK